MNMEFDNAGQVFTAPHCAPDYYCTDIKHS